MTGPMRSALTALDAGAVIIYDPEVDRWRERKWWLDRSDERRPIHWRTAVALLRRGWVCRTSYPSGGWTGRLVITNMGRRALRVAPASRRAGT